MHRRPVRARCALAVALALTLPLQARAQACGGSFPGFVDDLRQEALARGHDPRAVRDFFSGIRRDPDVIAADRRQGVFQLDFTSFARRLISRNRIETGAAKARQHAATFDRIEREMGVPRGILLAFWAFETDYGGFQGDINTADALTTLAHDCRRPELFRPQVFSALTLFERGDFDPDTTTGAWAGEIGQVQMLPADIIENGVDGDGDGHVRLKSSAPDALMSGARMLRSLGWTPNAPWLQEVQVPERMDWSLSGLATTRRPGAWERLGARPRSGRWQGDLPASLILPQGKDGPAFLAYPNFSVLFEWNQSFTYVLTAAYFATRLEGAPVFEPGTPAPGLDGAQMKRLQERLQARGYDVGGADGILGAGTRAAVRREQARLGMPVDGWPTPALLDRI